MESKKSWIFCDEPGGGADADDEDCVGADVSEVDADGLPSVLAGAEAASLISKVSL